MEEQSSGHRRTLLTRHPGLTATLSIVIGASIWGLLLAILVPEGGIANTLRWAGGFIIAFWALNRYGYLRPLFEPHPKD